MKKSMIQRNGITGYTLKLVAITCMLIDHIGAVIMESWMRHVPTATLYYRVYYGDLVLRGIGRLAFPLFCFLLVEGFHYTHSRLKYARNLLIFALISEIPFDLAFSHCICNLQSQNVYFTLLIGLLTLIGMEQLPGVLKGHRHITRCFYPSAFLLCGTVAWTLNNTYGIAGYFPQNTVWVAAAVAAILIILLYCIKYGAEQKCTFTCTVLPVIGGIFVAKLMKTDYNGLGILAISAMWLVRRSTVSSVASGVVCLSVGNLFETPALFDLLLVSKYNGQRGHQTKYLFYMFYPVHLTVLALINRLLGFAHFTIQ